MEVHSATCIVTVLLGTYLIVSLELYWLYLQYLLSCVLRMYINKCNCIRHILKKVNRYRSFWCVNVAGACCLEVGENGTIACFVKKKNATGYHLIRVAI